MRVISYKLCDSGRKSCEIKGGFEETVCSDCFQTEGLVDAAGWSLWLPTQQLSRSTSCPVRSKQSHHSSPSNLRLSKSQFSFRGSVLVRAAVLLGLRQVGNGEPQEGGHSAQLSQFWGEKLALKQSSVFSLCRQREAHYYLTERWYCGVT